jgi:hypothetical protein
MYIDYCWSETVDENEVPGTQKWDNKPSSTSDADIFYPNKILLIDKPLMKTESLLSQKSSSKPSSTATLKSSLYID